jgi:hypothetical protein
MTRCSVEGCGCKCMAPHTECSRHRPKPPPQKGDRHTKEYRRRWYAKRAQAGVMPGTEAA